MNRFTTFSIVLAFVFCLSGAAAAQVEPEKTNKSDKTQTAKQFYAKLAGDWEGSYKLWMRPDAPAQESDIKARFQDAAKGNQFLMTYSWKKAGETKDGIFLFGGDGKTATATWGDSFHMYPGMMQCVGELADDVNKLFLNGSYAAGEGPDWGWRTEFTLKDPNSLLMEAYNITPQGVEALAVRAEMKRVGIKGN